MVIARGKGCEKRGHLFVSLFVSGAARGILVSQPGTDAIAAALGVWSLNHGPPGKPLGTDFKGGGTIL